MVQENFTEKNLQEVKKNLQEVGKTLPRKHTYYTLVLIEILGKLLVRTGIYKNFLI